MLAALAAADIKAVVLKGGVHLFEGDQNALETRMMIDVDLLVSKDRLQESFEIATGLGLLLCRRDLGWVATEEPPSYLVQ